MQRQQHLDQALLYLNALKADQSDLLTPDEKDLLIGAIPLQSGLLDSDSQAAPASAAPVVDARAEVVRRLAIAQFEKANAQKSGYDRDALRLDGAVGVLENLLEDIDAAAATAAPVEQSDDEQLIALLLDWRKWYSEDLFTPWTVGEARRVHDEFPGAVDRISAESARVTIDHIIEDIRVGKHRITTDADNEEAR